MVKFLFISYSDTLGGASRAAFRNYLALRKKGFASNFYVLKKASSDSKVIKFGGSTGEVFGKIFSVINNFSVRLNVSKKINNFDPAVLGFNLKDVKSSRDLININWFTDGLLSFYSLKEYSSPLVITLHDMWFFTGGCHYAGNCKRYKNMCGKCPLLFSDKDYDLSREVALTKQNVLKGKDITVVCPSSWMKKCFDESFLGSYAKSVVIPYAIDSKIYKPLEKTDARKKLGLSKNKKIIAFGAVNSINDPRKGFKYLKKAIGLFSKNQENKTELLVFGCSKDLDLGLNLKCTMLGEVKDEKKLALIYSAADVFVVPSVQDNLPNTVIESLTCGTPVVAFNIGGLPDLINHKINGYLAKSFDSEDLFKGINFVLNKKDKSMNVLARKKALGCYSEEAISKAYKSFFEKKVNL